MLLQFIFYPRTNCIVILLYSITTTIIIYRRYPTNIINRDAPLWHYCWVTGDGIIVPYIALLLSSGKTYQQSI